VPRAISGLWETTTTPTICSSFVSVEDRLISERYSIMSNSST
jgi:hypothetical protein